MITVGPPKGNIRHGRKGNWPDACSADAVRERVKALRAQVEDVARRSTELVIRRLAWELAQFTLREADERRRSGQLEFHDLLVLARAVLRDPEHGWDVRRRLRARYTRLLLDEFQDTDPIQCDLAALLASGDPDAATTGGTSSRRPRPAVRRRRPQAVDLPVPPGRHRRLPARPFRVRRHAAPPHPQLPHHAPGDRVRQPRVPRPDRRRARNPSRRTAARSRPGAGPPRAASRAPRHAPPTRQADRRRAARARSRRRRRGHRHRARRRWPVARRHRRPCRTAAPSRAGSATSASCCPRAPRSASSKDALDAAGIPYRAETSSLVYGTREIRDLLVVLQAVDDPTDEPRS